MSFFTTEMIKLINGDCLEKTKIIQDESIDLLVTDCPYKITQGGTTIKKRKNEPRGILSRRGENAYLSKSGKLFKYNEIEFSDWLPEMYRVLKPNTHAYIMINARNLKNLQTACEEVGFVFQNLLIWSKGNYTPNRFYMQSYECILMVRKGRAKSINNMGSKNILEIPNVKNKKHPTEKPIELMKILIENSSLEGETILDPFMGAGSTGMACIDTNRNFIGIELDKRYYDIARERIEGHQQDVFLNGVK